MMRTAARSLLVVLWVASLPGCNRLGAVGAGTGEKVTGAAVVTVQRASRRFHVPAIGYLDALKASPLAVPRVPTGALKVRELVPEGSIVEAGQVVIVFDDTQLNIEMDNHRASFRSADRRTDRTALQAAMESGSIGVMREVAELTRDHAGTFRLADETIFSQLEILDTEVKQETAEETILFADASLLLRGQYYDIEKRILGVEKGELEGRIGRVRTSLGSLVLKAPLGGLIVYKKNWRGASVGVGDTLWPGNLVMSIVDPTSTVLTGYVLERDAAGVAVGAEAAITVDARPDRRFKGSVSSVAEVAAPIERGSPVKYCEVKVTIADGDPELLKPGMKGEARIVTGEISDKVVVPRSALRGKEGAFYVMIEAPGGVEKRAAVPGVGDMVSLSIEEGLKGGERVLVGGETAEPPAPRQGDASDKPPVESL